MLRGGIKCLCSGFSLARSFSPYTMRARNATRLMHKERHWHAALCEEAATWESKRRRRPTDRWLDALALGTPRRDESLCAQTAADGITEIYSPKSKGMHAIRQPAAKGISPLRCMSVMLRNERKSDCGLYT